MQFTITIRSGSTYFSFLVKQLHADKISESYQVIAKNKTLIFESNRPLWRNKKLYHHKPEWKMVGDMHNVDFKEKIIEAIMNVIDKK